MVTGLSHPPLIETSFWGNTKEKEKVEQYSPQMLPEIDMVCFHSPASPSKTTPRQPGRWALQPHSLTADCSQLDWLQSGAVLGRKGIVGVTSAQYFTSALSVFILRWASLEALGSPLVPNTGCSE